MFNEVSQIAQLFFTPVIEGHINLISISLYSVLILIIGLELLKRISFKLAIAKIKREF